MKKTFSFFLLLLFGCENESSEVAIAPHEYDEESEWAVYEGIVPTEFGEELIMELSLSPGSPGVDADYKLREWNTERNVYMMQRSSHDKYTTLTGPNPDEVIINLHRTGVNNELIHGPLTEQEAKRIAGKNRHKNELFFKSKDNELILLDTRLQEVDRSKYSLIRRSKLFTVEGYITFVNDTSEFFEMNTREYWASADRGMFSKAKSNYFLLAKEKFEGIYLRGLGYAIDHKSATGKNVEALVLRNIYEMRPGKPITP